MRPDDGDWCLFDNPVTDRRELWCDGRLVALMASAALTSLHRVENCPLWVGGHTWSAGGLSGNADMLPERWRGYASTKETTDG